MNPVKYKVVIRYKDKDEKSKEESTLLTALNEQDAEYQRHVNQEVAEKKHGKANVISVLLIREQYNTSQGLCPSCGAAVNLTAEKPETKCQYCETVVTLQQAEAQFNEVKNSKFGGTLLIAETAQEGGSYEEALNYYNKVIEQEPTFADAWLNKGICTVRTSKIGDLKIPEAISSWKAAIKFAKNPDAMKKRVALEINNAVKSFYPVLEQHYLKFHSLDDSLSEHGSRFLLLESAQSWAMELNPNETIAKNGIYLCDRFVGSITEASSSDANDATAQLFQKDWKGALASAASAVAKEGVASELATTLRKIKQKYKQVLDPNLIEFGIEPSVAELIFSGSIVDAIKKLRSFEPGLGLAEAKAAVERTEVELRAKYPQKFMPPTVSKKGGCFVATACYGDYDHPIVVELSRFRDDCLVTSTAGRAFVRCYYKWSPPFASIVAKNGILKTLARVLIVTPAVTIARIFTRKLQK